jgi:tetratricopeptide (TPR) repeat protein
LAESLYYGGRPEEAIIHVKDAMRLEPYYPIWFLGYLADTYDMVGRYEEANAVLIQQLKRARKENARPLFTLQRLVIKYMRLGRMEEARAQAADLLKIKPDYTVEFYRKMRPYKGEAYLDNQIDLLRKAGLPG